MTTELTDKPTDPGAADVRWNLADLYAGMDDPRIDLALTEAQARAEKLQAEYKGRINSPSLTAQTLGAALREYEALQQEAYKPITYASLLFAADTADAAKGAFLQKMRERGTQLTLPLLFLDLELAAAPDDVLTPLLDDPAVAPYKHYVGTVRAAREHVLSEVEERLMEELANTGGRAFDRLFDELTSAATFTLNGEELSQAQVISLTMDPDRETRRAASQSFTEGLARLSPTVTFIFNTLMQDKNVQDRLRRFETPQQSRHLANELDEATVSLVVSTVVQNYPLVARYYKIKREILGLDTLTHYDRYAPLFEAEGTITFPEARKIVLDSFGGFSPEMESRAAEFFDKRWIDAPAVKGKSGGAFCSYVTPDTHPYVLMNYLGKIKDVMTLAHELGHGVHASLSRKQTLLNFHGTLPLAELASTFGEMLVFEKVTQQAALKDKLALYAEKIEGAFATISRQTALYRFEQAIHGHRRTKGELTTEEFGDYWQTEIQAMFGDSVELGDEHRLWWSYVSHFIGSPFYVYAYSLGELLVLSLFQQSKRDGAAFAAKYLEMLEAGGSLAPQELISKVGVTLTDPAFWQGGFDALSVLVDDFESLWHEYKTS